MVQHQDICKVHHTMMTKLRSRFHAKHQVSNGSWWRHQMETFSALLAICAGNSLVTGEFPAQRPVMWSFDVFFDQCPNKWLSKQPWGWWFEMPSCSLWCHYNVKQWYSQVWQSCHCDDLSGAIFKGFVSLTFSRSMKARSTSKLSFQTRTEN